MTPLRSISMPTPFARLAEVAERLSRQSSRNEKLRILAAFFRSLESEEVAPAVRLLLGSFEAPLEVGWATLKKLASQPQAALYAEPLSIVEVWEVLRKVASLHGSGSRRRKEALLLGLFSRAGEKEAEYIARSILGEMRTGVSEGLLAEAIARAFSVSAERVRLAHALLGDLSAVAHLLATKQGLPEPRIRLFTPFKPMLAQPAAGIEEAVSGEVAVEYKYDGARVQIHRRGSRVKVYSRRLRELDIEEARQAALEIKAEQLVVEGELIALSRDGKPLPFQDVMRSLAGEEARLRLCLFDVLHLDGRDLLSMRYSARWEILSRIARESLLAERIVTSDLAEARKFYERALAEGHEGVVVKRLDSSYEPGKRSSAWLKVKPFVTLDLAVIAAEWGHGRRRGWLSNLHLGVRAENGSLLMVGKTFKGLTDAMLEEITSELLKHKVEQAGHVVKVKPTLVVEVAFDEVQRSPRYDSGFALRFARVKRIRRDKGIDEVDTLETLKKIYETQLRRKGKL